MTETIAAPASMSPHAVMGAEMIDPKRRDSSQKVQQIAIGNLNPSPLNPRKTIDAAFLAQLASSIEQLGVQVPLLVRPASFAKGNISVYEIVAGHRRYFAAQHTKLTTLPCIVREMTDDEASEIMVVENLQREDLPALEEADAYEGLLATLGSAPAVAARVGKPVEYVTRRLKLRTLIPFSRQALGGKLIAVDHALLLSKLADKEQETALRFVLQPGATRKDKTADIVASALKDLRGGDDDAGESRWHRHYWQPQSVQNLKSFIEREIKLELKRAPWDLGDANLLPSAGACSGCAKNTAANTALFGDLAVSDARCTDAVCFNAKRDAFVQVQLAAVQSAGKDAVRISWKRTSAKPSKLQESSEKYLAQTFKAGQWVEAKKGSCGFVHAGVTVDFDEQIYGTADAKKKPGMTLLVCVAAGCKAHKKEWEKPAPSNGGMVNQNSAEARAKREKNEQLVKAENAIRAELVKKAIAKVDRLAGELLRSVVLRALPSWLDRDDEAMFPGLESSLGKCKVDSPEFARAAACLLFVGDDCEAFLAPWADGLEGGRKELIAILKVLGFDAGSVWDAKRPSPAKPEAPVKKSSPARKATFTKEQRAKVVAAQKKRLSAAKKKAVRK
jgi:ParB/RepB/Spo0J family partition protein